MALTASRAGIRAGSGLSVFTGTATDQNPGPGQRDWDSDFRFQVESPNQVAAGPGPVSVSVGRALGLCVAAGPTVASPSNRQFQVTDPSSPSGSLVRRSSRSQFQVASLSPSPGPRTGTGRGSVTMGPGPGFKLAEAQDLPALLQITATGRKGPGEHCLSLATLT